MAWRSAALAEDSPLSPWARLAVAALCEYMGGEKCYPALATIAGHMGASERKARDAIRELEREGFLTVSYRDGFTNLYFRTLPTPAPRAGVTPVGSPARTPARTPARRAPEPEEPEEPDEPGSAELTLNGQLISDRRTSARLLVAYYVDLLHADGVPVPSRQKGHVARHVGELLDDGVPPETIARALDLMHERRLNPATLPSLIAEAHLGPGGREHMADQMLRELRNGDDR